MYVISVLNAHAHTNEVDDYSHGHVYLIVVSENLNTTRPDSLLKETDIANPCTIRWV